MCVCEREKDEGRKSSREPGMEKRMREQEKKEGGREGGREGEVCVLMSMPGRRNIADAHKQTAGRWRSCATCSS